MSLSMLLNKRVTLKARAAGQDAAGQPAITWSDVVTVWAGVVDLSGREFLAAGGAQNATQTKITIRYRAGVTPAMRVVCGADTYNIETVLGQDRRSLTLMCSRLEA